MFDGIRSFGRGIVQSAVTKKWVAARTLISQFSTMKPHESTDEYPEDPVIGTVGGCFVSVYCPRTITALDVVCLSERDAATYQSVDCGKKKESGTYGRTSEKNTPNIAVGQEFEEDFELLIIPVVVARVSDQRRHPHIECFQARTLPNREIFTKRHNGSRESSIHTCRPRSLEIKFLN